MLLRATLCSFILAVACVMPQCSHADDDNQIATDAASERLSQQLAELDEGWAFIRQQVWSVQDYSQVTPADLRGRHANDDIRDYVLNVATERTLRRQRLHIEQLIGDTRLSEAQQALGECVQALIAESKRLGEVLNYWVTLNKQLMPHRERWQRYSKISPGYQVPNNIAATETKIITSLNAGNFSVEKEMNELITYYRDESEELRKTARSINNAQLTFYPRRTECLAPTTVGSSGRNSPKLISNALPDYPAAAKQLREEGLVTLRINVDVKGCVSDVAIALSSGWIDLDDAALDWIETVHFLPAEQEGHVIASTVSMPLRFRLEE